jgi:hypothetical protein
VPRKRREKNPSEQSCNTGTQAPIPTPTTQALKEEETGVRKMAEAKQACEDSDKKLKDLSFPHTTWRKERRQDGTKIREKEDGQREA